MGSSNTKPSNVPAVGEGQKQKLNQQNIHEGSVTDTFSTKHMVAEFSEKQELEFGIYKRFKKDALTIPADLQERIMQCNKLVGTYKKPPFLKEIHKHKTIMEPVMIKPTQIYIGQWSQGSQNGFGQLIDQLGTYYIGYFYQNQPHEHGRMIYENGDYYEGEWNLGYPSGSGAFYNKNGQREFQIQAKCFTEFIDFPTLIDNNESRYYGKLIEGMKQGEGLQQWEDGTYYLGEFDNDLKNGRGNMVYVNGNSYKGSYLRNKMDGVGYYTWADGKYYYGGYKNDLKEGFGIYFTGLTKFEGFFKEGKMHGKGSYIDIRSNTIHNGLWEEGKKLPTVEAKKRGYVLA